MEPERIHAKDTDVFFPSTRIPSSLPVRQSITPIGIILPAVVVSVVFVGCFLMKYIKKHYPGTQPDSGVLHQTPGRHPHQPAVQRTHVPLPQPPPPYEECVVHGVGVAAEMREMGRGGTEDPALPDYEEAIREGFIQIPYTGITQGPHESGCLHAMDLDTRLRMGDV